MGNNLKKCLVCSCPKPSRSKGFCNLHYQRHIRGIPMDGNPKPTLLERIMAKVTVIPDGCWLWTGARAGMRPNHLYGYINIDGRLHRVHRVLWEINRGLSLGTLHLLHRCDNPLCVNPDHTFPGTHQDNMDDMIAKGRDRHPHGEVNHSRLTEQAVLQILGADSQDTHASLGRQYHVHPQTIKNIREGKKWAYLHPGGK